MRSSRQPRFLRGRARPAVEALVAFIDAHQQVFGVEPICKVLTSDGLKIATSTYYAAKNRTPSARSLRDARLKSQISRVHADNFGVYGVRKVWRQLHREGVPVARCTVARLMRDLGLEGARRGKRIRTTNRDDGHERASDLLRRDFTASGPNERWVADRRLRIEPAELWTVNFTLFMLVSIAAAMRIRCRFPARVPGQGFSVAPWRR